MANDTEDRSIAVVIPLYNKRHAIARALSSVLAQTRQPAELIVVDDGSSDGSLEIAKNVLARAENNIQTKIVSQANSGVSIARNRGYCEANSTYISFLDADDEWLPGYLAEVIELASTFPNATVLTTRSGKICINGQVVPEPCSLTHPFFGIVENVLEEYKAGYGLIHTSSVTVRCDAMEKSGGFPPGAHKSQDIYLWLKLAISETFAHSSKTLTIWHDDFSGVSGRKGVVPYHFSYFLGTAEGLQHLDNPALVNFLCSNLLIHIGGHRLTQDKKVVKELLQLSQSLPMRHRVKSWLVSIAPLTCLELVVWYRHRSRGLKR